MSFNVMLYHDASGWSLDSLEPSLVNNPNKIVEYRSLNSAQKATMENVISKFKTIGQGKLGRTSLIEYKISTGNASPIKQNHYSVSPKVKERFGKELQRMKDLDVIEKSYSPWCSPVVLVKKKDGRDRLCIDSRKLNSVTIKDSYPLPRINDIIDNLGTVNFLTKLDCKDSFWQIPLSELRLKLRLACQVMAYGNSKFCPLISLMLDKHCNV